MLKQYQHKFNEMNLEYSCMLHLEELVDDMNGELDSKTKGLKTLAKNQMDNELKSLQALVNELVKKFQDKRLLIGECRHEEKDKRELMLKGET